MIWKVHWQDAAASSWQAGVFLSSCQHQGSPAPSALFCCDVAKKEAGLSALPNMQTHEGNDRLTAPHAPSCYFLLRVCLSSYLPLTMWHPSFYVGWSRCISLSIILLSLISLSLSLALSLSWLILSLCWFPPSLPPLHLLQYICTVMALVLYLLVP